MRRDEYLNKLESEKANSIPKSIFSEVCTQWEKAGFDYKTLTDENGNWFIKESDWYEAERTNKAFSDMQGFCRKKLNWCINAEKHRWYNRSEAAGILFEQYLFYSVKQDRPVPKNIVTFPNEDGRTFKNAQVFDGWKESTKKEKRSLFLNAVAATIMDEVNFYHKEVGISGSFIEWFDEECSHCFVLKKKGKPHPYMVFGDVPGQSKHYKLTRVADTNGVPTYECQATLEKENKRKNEEHSEKIKRFFNEVLLYVVFIAILSLFVYAILAIIM